MLEKMHLESINVGQVETISHKQKSFTTGICKHPIEGVAFLEEAGVRGDSIVNTEHHGGADQAVYAYSTEDYDWWADETGRDVTAGLFGENLTIRGLPSDMNVGDMIDSILGPLGNPTHVEKVGTVICVGGGIGNAPLLPITKAMKQIGNKVISIIGARNKELLILEDDFAAR